MLKPLSLLLISGLLSGTNSVLVRNDTEPIVTTAADAKAEASKEKSEGEEASSEIPPDDDIVQI